MRDLLLGLVTGFALGVICALLIIWPNVKKLRKHLDQLEADLHELDADVTFGINREVGP